MDALAIARGGMQAASARFEASAERTAQMGAEQSGDGANDPNKEPVDLPKEVVEQISAAHQFSANLGVFRIADEMWRSLLEIQSDHHHSR